MRAALLASTAARRGFASTSTSTAAAGAAAGAAWQQQQQQQTASSGSLRGSLRLRLGSSSGSAQGTRTVYVWGRPAASSSLGARRGLAAAAAAAGGAGGSGSEDPHPHFKLVLPDMGQSTKSGSVTVWRKEEGDFIKNGDVVCEVEMDEFTVGMEIDDKGYLARILVPAGTKDVPVGEPLAVLVYNEKDVGAFSHLAPYRPEGAAAGAGGDGVDAGGSVGPADGTALLKFIHKLVRGGQINDKEFAKRLQALARHEDRELLRVFEASFEGPEGTRREEDFDAEFFFENARGVLDERDRGGKPVVMAAGAGAAPGEGAGKQ